ncbi:MAG: M1 family aminopeptidase, partial [bacterium]
MEYPSLVTIDPSPLAPSFIRAREYVTAHELAHQWFYGAIASDEHRHPVLDEGLTEFATGQVIEELYGPRSLGGVASLGLGFWALQGSFSALSSDDGPLVRDASAFAGFDAYANLVYRRTAALFASVSRDSLDAQRALERALARYAREQRFRHPTPEDLV